MSEDVCPLPLESLIAYAVGELPDGDAGSCEEHLFACQRCARRLDTMMRLGNGIADGVRDGRVSAAVTGTLVAQATRHGAHVREYRLQPGETIACTAGPDDSFVAIRLAAPAAGAEVTLDVEFHDLTTGARLARRIDGVPVDARTAEVVLLFPGEVVRGYPRSRWTLVGGCIRDGQTVQLGPYVLDHTPWEQLHPS